MKNKLLILLPVFLILCTGTGAQVPSLGTAGNFAVFTSAGAFNNLGASVIVGDVGTGAGVFTGFPPGSYSGQSHVADAAAVQAATDVNNAYSSLSALSCTDPLDVGLGNGQVIFSGIYCIDAACTLNGDLTLDGGGNSSAIFIIKIDGALSTGISSHVLLTNGATSGNIYWQVNGQFDLGDGSAFAGTIIASGAVNLLSGSSVTGRVWSTAGAISMNNNYVVLPLGVLATEERHFSAVKQGATAVLRWTTTDAISTACTAERSNTGITGSWQPMGTTAAFSHTGSINNFMIADNKPFAGNNYYRLKTSVNGAFASYSEIRLLCFASAEHIQLNAFPNPVKNDVFLTGAPAGSTIILTDIHGRVLHRQAGALSNNSVHTGNLQAGSYFIKVVIPGGQSAGVTILKQ